MSILNLDLNFNVNSTLQQFNSDYINKAKSEISKYKKYDIERLQTLELHKCNSNQCMKNAIYLDKKNNQNLCWYHGLLLTKG
jgi:hypothetical protein